MEKEKNFRNYMADDPYLKYHAVIEGKKKRDFCACGLNASGGVGTEIPEPESDVKSKVMNLTAWGYVKTALALVGAFVVGSWVYKKYIK